MTDQPAEPTEQVEETEEDQGEPQPNPYPDVSTQEDSSVLPEADDEDPEPEEQGS